MANKQIIGDVRVYSRHSAGCEHEKDAPYLRCDCPKWMQWQQNGKPVRKPAGTRTIAGLKMAAEKKTKELRGEVVEEASPITVEQALKDWLAFREQNGLGNEKAKLMGHRLVEWANDHDILYLLQMKTDRAIDFRDSLPYKTKTSSSLKIHWSIISGFFGWAHGKKLIAENPLPDTKVFPQFKIRVIKPEVVPPTAEEVQKVIDAAEGMTKLFIQTMRYSGMAIRDTSILSREKLTGNLIRGNRQKTHQRYRVRIPQAVADALHSLPGQYFFWDGRTQPTSVVHLWERRLKKVFEAAKVSMTPHGFRHHFISEQCAAGVVPSDVSKMVGTSEAEIRKTYEHSVKEGEDRLDSAQEAVWEKMGLDREGNKKEIVQ